MRELVGRRCAAAVAFALVSFACGGALADAEQDRLNQEARTLFQLVTSQEKPPQHCQYQPEWDTYAIPDYVARKVFRIKVHGGLVAPFEVADFSSIADPDGRHPRAFCSKAEVKTFTEEKIKAFEVGSDTSMQIDRTYFTYPVFDEMLQTAVVVISHIAEAGRYRSNGRIGRQTAGFAAVAKIYRKVRGRWHLTGSQQLAIS